MSWEVFSISWISISIAFFSAQYFLFGITRVGSVIFLVMSCAISWAIAHGIRINSASPTVLPQGENSRIAWNLKGLVAGFLLAPLWFLYTDAAVSTPWWRGGFLTGVVCAMYGVGTWYLLRRGNQESRIVFALHGFVTVGLAQLVFAYGYGFDPVVHEAALREVVLHGQVLPVQFLYSSYYGALAALHMVTAIPVSYLASWVVPIAAAIVVGFVAPWAFQVLWGATAANSRRAAVLLSIVGVPIFVISTPWSASVLLASVLVLLSPLAAQQTWRVYVLFATLIFAIVLLHPLMGIPVAIASVCAMISARGRITSVVAALFISVSIVGMFGWLRVTHGVPFFEHAHSWMSLVRFIVNTYGVRLIWLVASIVVLARWHREIPTLYRRMVTGLVAGMIFTAAVLWLYVPAPSVASSDQFEYAWRLLLGALVMVSPAIAIMLVRTFRTKSIVAAVLLSVAMTLSWYAMYPSQHSTVRVVSSADIRSVQFIPSDATVLSDQVFAQAGLKVYGFPSRYPIDVTTDIAQRATAMLYRSAAQALDGVTYPVYIAVHTYWYRAEAIDVEARAAGLQLLREDGVVRVYGRPMDTNTSVR